MPAPRKRAPNAQQFGRCLLFELPHHTMLTLYGSFFLTSSVLSFKLKYKALTGSNNRSFSHNDAIATDRQSGPAFSWVRSSQKFSGRMHSMRRGVILAALAAAALGVVPTYAARTAAQKDAEVYIIWPPDGAVIHGGALWLRMGLRNMGVCPKGVEMSNCGHHHVLLDAELPPMDEQIPSDRNHLHFGAGETEARIELPPGKHTLQLLLGDHNHVPHDPPVYSKKISITVK